ncbi:MAG: pseudouridylate synthase [Saprospiraceae bacterium]|nr:pseudouridylate synthase [Saprospiraceae bacterium]
MTSGTNIRRQTPGLEIIFENESLVAVNKPHGLLVHRSSIAADAQEFALQILRNQIGIKVYPAHRIDRKTCGVLLFAKSAAVNQVLQKFFREGKVVKTYIAIVRGFVNEAGVIDYPLENGGKVQEATTTFKRIKRFEISLPSGKFKTSRYSLVQLIPSTGRFHQLRKHLAHINHPILGDRPHGCNKQNRLWKEKYDMTTMMLWAKELSFCLSGDETITIFANASPEFEQCLALLDEGNIMTN